MSLFEKTKGTANEVGGKVQEQYGEYVDSPEHQIKGVARQVYGKGINTVSDVVDSAGQQVKNNPLTAVAVSAGVAFVIGFLIGRK